MIAVDTSALMAIVLLEPAAPVCKTILETEPDVLISAATVTEALIVASGRGVGALMRRLLDEFDLQIVPVTETSAKRAAASHAKWGKGIHPAGLNLSDCFAYEVAMSFSCPLLFVGEDFTKTDIGSAVSRRS